jgi:hypothetical protein
MRAMIGYFMSSSLIVPARVFTCDDSNSFWATTATKASIGIVLIIEVLQKPYVYLRDR